VQKILNLYFLSCSKYYNAQDQFFVLHQLFLFFESGANNLAQSVLDSC